MKKALFGLMTILMMVVVCVAFTACGSDSSDDNSGDGGGGGSPANALVSHTDCKDTINPQHLQANVRVIL